MARITVEDCLKYVDNRFSLIHMAAKRVRQIRKGAEPTIASKNRDVVVALREIAAGNVVKALDPEQDDLLLEKGPDPEAETEPAGDDAQKPEKGDEASAEG